MPSAFYAPAQVPYAALLLRPPLSLALCSKWAPEMNYATFIPIAIILAVIIITALISKFTKLSWWQISLILSSTILLICLLPLIMNDHLFLKIVSHKGSEVSSGSNATIIISCSALLLTFIISSATTFIMKIKLKNAISHS